MKLKSMLIALAASTAFAQVAPQAIVRTEEAARFLVPAAGSVRGGGNLEYRTDLTLVNFDRDPQNVRIEWIPQAGDTTSSAILPLGFLGFGTFEDIVAQRLNRSGVGAVLVTAVNADGSFDSGARLDAHARIRATPAGGAAGTLSLGIPPMTLDGWRNGSPAYIHGVRSNGYRINVGVVNFDRAAASRFRLLVRSALGSVEREIELAPFTMTQLPVANAPFGDLSIYIEPRAGAGDWRAYATATDNITQSGWYVPAMQPRVDVVFPAP